MLQNRDREGVVLPQGFDVFFKGADFATDSCAFQSLSAIQIIMSDNPAYSMGLQL